MAIVNDEAFVAGAANGQISGAFRAVRALDDLLAERTESRWGTGGLKSELDIGRFDLAARWRGRGDGGTGSGKPERIGIQRQETRRRRGSIAELEAQFDGGDL